LSFPVAVIITKGFDMLAFPSEKRFFESANSLALQLINIAFGAIISLF